MIKLIRIAVLAMPLLGAGGAPQAQTAHAAHGARIEDAAWLAGRWVGTGFDGEMEESWSPPTGGQMIGHFRYSIDGQPQFYEMLLMDVIAEGVRMRVKHFNPDATAWEEKDRWVTFAPVSVGPDALVFRGLAIRREAENRIVMTITLRQGDTVRDEILRFERAPL
jgi:hypothetical protein